jgi:hypothetical protein
MKSRIGILVAAVILCGSIGLTFFSTAIGKPELPPIPLKQEPTPSPTETPTPTPSPSPSPSPSPTPVPEPEPVPTATPKFDSI